MVHSKRVFLSMCLVSIMAAVAGCGGSAGKGKTVVLNGFEKQPDPSASRQVYDLVESLKKPDLPVDDYGWATSGYVDLEPFNKYATQGKITAKARFTVPGDFKKADRKPKSWEAGMTLSTETPTKLAETDWSGYRFLAIDIYNPENREYQASLRVVDSHSNVTETAQLIRAKGKTIMFMEITRLAEARIDTKDLKALTLYMNTVDEPKDPVLYIDNLRLTSNTVLR